MTYLLFICHRQLFPGGDGNTGQVGILATFIHLFISHVPTKFLLIFSWVPGISKGHWSKVEALWWCAVQLWGDELAVDFRLLLLLLYRVGRRFPLLSVPGSHTMTMWYCGSPCLLCNISKSSMILKSSKLCSALSMSHSCLQSALFSLFN